MDTVYLVDDDKIIIDQFLSRRNLFLECGFEIAGAETNPLKALAEIRAIGPDAVFCDLKMPELDGIGLLKELSRDANPPIFVMISAYNDFADVRRLFKNDGFDYLVKPVTNPALTELLMAIKERIHKTPPLPVRETPSEPLNRILIFLNEYPAINHSLEATAERYELNPKTVCKLFSKYLNTTFIAYLTQIRMERAEELLRATDFLVKKVAQQCGYPDHFYFTRIFTRLHGGQSPTEYREHVR